MDREEVRLWHDDIRVPPNSKIETKTVDGVTADLVIFDEGADEWLWARTNTEAIEILTNASYKVIEISLDHDLGHHDKDPRDYDEPHLMMGQGKENGLDLVEWMLNSARVPDKVTIHSRNEEGAKAMNQLLAEWGYGSLIAPWEKPEVEA